MKEVGNYIPAFELSLFIGKMKENPKGITLTKVLKTIDDQAV